MINPKTHVLEKTLLQIFSPLLNFWATDKIKPFGGPGDNYLSSPSEISEKYRFLWTQESHMWSRRNFFFLKNPQRHDFTIAQCQYGESYGLLLICIWKLRLWQIKRHLRIVCTSIFNEFRATWVNQVKFCNFFQVCIFSDCVSLSFR